MPSFADALTLEQIDRVTAYLRTLCPEPVWPLGESEPAAGAGDREGLPRRRDRRHHGRQRQRHGRVFN